jgi:hypothetical protein
MHEVESLPQNGNKQESVTDCPVNGVSSSFVDELNEGISKINSVLEKYSIPNVKKTIFPMISDGKLSIFVSPEILGFLSGNPGGRNKWTLRPVEPQQ